jgi:regulator of sigma E protease
MLLAIQWGVIGIKTLQLILSLSILVILHEGGHFIPAKIFKCRVEKFYLFFDPWFSIIKKKIGETVYGIGWIPFGGYVKISGMIDESMDKEQMKQPPQPYEFRSKPAWQRLIIMIGGVVVNVLLAIVIFAGIMFTWGDEYLPPQNLKYGMYADSLGRTIGLRDGDIITKVGNNPVKNAVKTVGQIVTSDATTITVNRNGEEINLPITDDLIKALHKTKLEKFADIRVPFIIDSVVATSDAAKKGVQKGDRIIGVDSIQTVYANEFLNAMQTESKKDSVQLKVLRNADTLNFTVALNSDKKIGIQSIGDIKKLGFITVKQNYGLLAAIPAGARKCWDVLHMNLVGFKQIFTGQAKASESLGSVISIGNLFPGEWDWENFWSLTGILSVILAFMNILPIPALDGGHALFTLVEMITGKKPSDKFMERAQLVGMILLLTLMAYALGLDFMRLFRK